MKKRILSVVCVLAIQGALSQVPTFAAGTGSFVQYYDAAQSYLANGQYSSAIVDFRKDLINL
ncbi:MAG: hypothetical protein MJ231_08690, partial [bacterium]|nr:hypothetical protein [bacterium]